MLTPEQQKRRELHARALTDIGRMTDPHAALKKIQKLFSEENGLQYFNCSTQTAGAETLDYQRQVVMEAFEQLRYAKFSETSHTMQFDDDMPVYMWQYARMLRDEVGVPHVQIQRPYYGKTSVLKDFGLRIQHWNIDWWCDGDELAFGAHEDLLDLMCGSSARSGRTWLQAVIPLVLSIGYNENLRKRANLMIGMCRMRIYSKPETKIQIQTNGRAKLFGAKLAIELPLDVDSVMPDTRSPQTATCGRIYEDFSRPGIVGEMRMRCDNGALHFP